MFHQATATSKSKHDHAICQGRWEPSVEQDVEREPMAMELIWPDSSWEDIVDLYHDVYQLGSLLGKICCDEEMEVCICQEVMDSVKEYLWCKQLSTLPGVDLRWSPVDIPRLDPQAKFDARNCTTYDRFMGIKQDYCKEALAMARDAHWWALAATTLWEDKIERMSCSHSHSHWCSGSHRHLGSYWQRKSHTVDHQTKVPQVMSCHGDPAKRWAQSLSPSQSRQQVTFSHSSPKSSPKRDISVKRTPPTNLGGESRPGDQSDWSRPEEEDLECPPSLEPHVQEFLRGEEMLLAGAGVGDSLLQSSTPEPSPTESAEWIKWHMQQLDMPAWWWELKEVPSQDNLQEFAQSVWASFEVPKVWSCT